MKLTITINGADDAPVGQGELLPPAKAVASVMTSAPLPPVNVLMLLMCRNLFEKGFCRPQEEQEQDDDNQETTHDGTGVGEGEGSKDVSNEIENEEQRLRPQKARRALPLPLNRDRRRRHNKPEFRRAGLVLPPSPAGLQYLNGSPARLPPHDGAGDEIYRPLRRDDARC